MSSSISAGFGSWSAADFDFRTVGGRRRRRNPPEKQSLEWEMLSCCRWNWPES